MLEFREVGRSKVVTPVFWNAGSAFPFDSIFAPEINPPWLGSRTISDPGFGNERSGSWEARVFEREDGMPSFSHWGAGASLAAAMLLAALPSHANPLANPGFEMGNFSGWTVGGTNGGSGVASNGTVIPGTEPPFGTVTVLAHSGNYGAFGVVAESSGESLTLSQTVNLVPGSYDIGYYIGNNSSSPFGVSDGIVDGLMGIIVNGTHLTISFNPVLDLNNNFPITTTAAEMEEVTSHFSSSGGSTTIEFDISGSGNARAGISVDDFFVNAVPEPDTVALLGIAFGGLMWFRHRRKT